MNAMSKTKGAVPAVSNCSDDAQLLAAIGRLHELEEFRSSLYAKMSNQKQHSIEDNKLYKKIRLTGPERDHLERLICLTAAKTSPGILAKLQASLNRLSPDGDDGLRNHPHGIFMYAIVISALKDAIGSLEVESRIAAKEVAA